MNNAYFIGIGGLGMSGLAKILYESGGKVAGSDRNIDGDYCKRLRDLGVKIYNQDGSGIEKFMADSGLSSSEFRVIKSTAVEDKVPDVVTANKLGIKQIMRSDLLAEMFNIKKGIAIGGTAGKTTTTGLVTWILKYIGKEPSCAVGGIITGLETNAFIGKGENFVIEADESDGSIVKYTPYISIVTNISRDHKPMDELKSLFCNFFTNTNKDGFCLVCADDPNAFSLKNLCEREIKTYGIHNDADYRAENIVTNGVSSTFKVNSIEYTVNMPGEHNILNALAAIAACNCAGICLNQISEALSEFPGMKRRFEKRGERNGVVIIDDFAHNPAEIEAALNAARKQAKNIFAVYQPHGFNPTNFTKAELINVFSKMNPQNEFLYLDEIFYSGGTVDKNISSENIANEVIKEFSNVKCPHSRELIVNDILANAKAGDIALIMGARDVNNICEMLLNSETNN